jgi:hypothetical protein
VARLSERIRLPSRPKGGGMVMLDWPGHDGGACKSSKKHCAECGGCNDVKCWNKSFEHSECQKHRAAG